MWETWTYEVALREHPGLEDHGQVSLQVVTCALMLSLGDIPAEMASSGVMGPQFLD